jgi:hypothetical protein
MLGDNMIIWLIIGSLTMVSLARLQVNFMSEIFQVSIVRRTKNYEAMVKFYRDSLGMKITAE